MSEKAESGREQSDYQSYLLRLWRVDEEDKVWQVSLESARTGERRGFADLEAMLDFLRRRVLPPATSAKEDGAGANERRDERG